MRRLLLAFLLFASPAAAQFRPDPQGNIYTDIDRVRNVLITAPATAGDNVANPLAPYCLTFQMLWDGATWDRAPGNSATGALVTGPLTDTQLRATPVPVSGTVTVTDGAGALNVIVDSGAITSDSELPAAAALADNTANPTVPGVGSFLHAWDGTNWDRVQTGAAASGALKVDGSAVTQPVSLAVFPDNEPFNLAQVAGATVATGNGTAAGSLRVSLASDSTGTTAATQATAANLNMRPDTSGATGAAPPARAEFSGGIQSGATGGFLGGATYCDSFANITIVTATTTLIVTGVSGRHVRICAISIITAGANNVALISGTGATCGTGTTGMTGGTTAATGYNFAANGGIAQGAGIGTINQTNATGDSVCIITSAAVQLSGRVSYAIW